MNEEFQFKPITQPAEAPKEYFSDESSFVEPELEQKPKRSRTKSKKKEVAPEPQPEPISEKTETPVRIYAADKLRARLRR